MLKERRDNCTFCRSNFPENYQLVSNKPKYWLFILNREPQCDFHSLIVLKKHFSDLSSRGLPREAMKEFGLLLKRACISIKKADPKIRGILVISLNTGKGTKHLHFHLIPRRQGEPIKTVNNPKEDGAGMFFLGGKEIVVDTFSDFLNSTTGNESSKLIEKIGNATKNKVTKNARQLRIIFEKSWKTDNKQIQRTRNMPR